MRTPLGIGLLGAKRGFNSAARRVMPMGDSITQGQGALPGYRATFWANTRPTVNVDMTGSRYTNAGSVLGDGDHEGHNAFKILDCNSLAAGWIGRSPVDDIILMVGTNDCIVGTAAATSLTNLQTLLATIKAAAPAAKVIVCTIPPLAGQPAIRASYNAGIPNVVSTAVAGGQSATLCDINAGAAVTLQSDGTHPDAAGHATMGAAIATTYLSVVGVAPGGGPIQYVDGSGAVTGNTYDLTKLTSLAGLQAWHDCRSADITLGTTDAYGRTPIASWAPRAGAQATANLVPFQGSVFYQASGPSKKPIAEFLSATAGGASLKYSPALASPSGDHVFIAAVAACDFTSANQWLFDSQTGRLVLMPANSSTGGQYGFYDGAFHNNGAAVAKLQIMTWRFAGTVATIRRNGVVVATDTYAAKAIGGVTSMCGDYTGGGANMNGYVAGFAYLDTNPSDANLLAAEQQLALYYGS